MKWIFSGLVFLLFSCGDNAPEPQPVGSGGTQPKPAESMQNVITDVQLDSNRVLPDPNVLSPDRAPLNKLFGQWIDKDQSTAEEWLPHGGNGPMIGKGYQIDSAGNLQLFEDIQIVQDDSAWYYAVTTANQNDGEEVRFLLTLAGADFLQFSNPEHDFPKDIRYDFMSDSTIKVSVSADGRGFELLFQREPFR